MYRKLTVIINQPRSVAAAFTLPEVIAAAALLIIAVVPILKGLTVAHLNTKLIERKTLSLALAQAELDEIKAKMVYYYDQSFDAGDVVLYGAYLCDVIDKPGGTDLREIEVSVGYDLNGNNRLAADEILITLTTLVAKRW